jgi:hypothetical protein
MLERDFRSFFETRVTAFPRPMIPKWLTGGLADYSEARRPREAGEIDHKRGFLTFDFENHAARDPRESFPSSYG